MDISPRNGVGIIIVSTAGINIYYYSRGKNPKHIFVYLQRTNKTLNQEGNPHIFDTSKINDDNCYLHSARMEAGNGIYYLELEYSYDNMARIYRDVINYAAKQNDKNTGSLLTRENFHSLFGLIHFNLTCIDEALQSSDPKQLILRYRLSQAAGDDYKVYALIFMMKRSKFISLEMKYKVK